MTESPRSEALGEFRSEISLDEALVVLNGRLGQVLVAWVELDGGLVIGASAVLEHALEPYQYRLVPLSQHRPGFRTTGSRGDSFGFTPPDHGLVDLYSHGLRYPVEGGEVVIGWPPDHQGDVDSEES